ncbi:MAG: ANTAR domain-containing protein [Cellulomonas sp.]|uniref:ANTAR domain-containing protein n=1 Tax=Cellulomonas sp. TaxID=40001 RepID=UPI0019F1C906|nr:ANTAR domain-containing protein [Cellulomonas sp.]MBF0689756.1 ANTAR domain-containing protein [Cellulomonas sp.]
MTTYLDDHARAASDEMGEGYEASITVRHHGAVLRAASSSPGAARCDLVEARMDEGPCLEAMDGLGRVAVRVVGEERRWPHWSARTLDEGFVACVALPVRVAQETVLAINYYVAPVAAGDPPWDVAERRVQTVAGQMRARLDVASTGLLALQAPDTLEGDQAVVDRAVGAAMQCNQVDAADAYQVLARAASERGVTLVQMSHDLLAVLAEPSPADA